MIFVKLYYWKHSGDRGPQILASRATCSPPVACWAALLEANAGGLHQIRPRSLPFAYLLVYLSLFVLQFDAVISHPPTASFNKPPTNKNETLIGRVTCSTSRPNLLYIVCICDFFNDAVSSVTVRWGTHLYPRRAWENFWAKFSMNSDHKRTYELVAMVYPLLPTHYVHSTLGYSSKVD